MKTTVFLAVMVAGIAYAVGVTIFYERCNENKCVTRVSKCQLTGACGCTLENCTCCVNCTLCLAELWDDCCACVSKFSFIYPKFPFRISWEIQPQHDIYVLVAELFLNMSSSLDIQIRKCPPLSVVGYFFQERCQPRC